MSKIGPSSCCSLSAFSLSKEWSVSSSVSFASTSTGRTVPAFITNTSGTAFGGDLVCFPVTVMAISPERDWSRSSMTV